MDNTLFYLPDKSLWTPKRFEHKYTPIIKHKGFDPSPVAGRIPPHADPRIDPDVIDSPLYIEFWDEQIDRCENGYSTGGLKIPGRYYYFLNFQPLSGVKGVMYPFFCDFHLELALTVEWIKFYKITGLIALKARRKGLSEFMKGAVINYGLTFVDAYRGAVFAGIDNYVKGLKRKIIHGLINTVDDMRMNMLKNNDKELKIGYEQKINGNYTEAGALSEVQFETMFNSDSKLEGEYFNDVISEESGENPKLKGSFESIRPALMFGSEMEGTFYIYGTAGNILSGSKDFIEMYRNHESFDLIKVWVPGTRLYYPFFVTKNEYVKRTTGEEDAMEVIKEGTDPIKNLRPLIDQYGRDCLLGCEDVDSAQENIKFLYKRYENLQDKKNLIELKKNFPLDEDDAIVSGGSNNFNNELLYARLNDIQTKVVAPGNYVLDFVMEGESKNYKMPLEVSMRLATPEDEDWKVVQILQGPLAGMKNVDVQGVDSYNQDQTNTSKSLGGIVVLRDGRDLPSEINGIKIRKAIYPICCYEKRPPRKEYFYKISLMISVLYNLTRDVMISAEHDFLIDYYKKNFGRKYLSYRPRSFDSPSSEAVHEFGAKLISPMIISRVLGIGQSWVEDYIQFCDFEVLIRGLIAFDEINIGSDWDIVDALLYALMRIIDRKAKPINDNENLKSNDSITWVEDKDGHLVSVTTSKENEDDCIYMGNKKIHG